MNINKQVAGYLVFHKVQISNANSISSPITYGFPAITGFLGAFHSMSRKMMAMEEWQAYSLGGVLLACYDCQPQIYRASKYSNYTFNQSRNPIKKDGKTASIIEEGKCHLTMSFVVEVLGTEDLSIEEQKHLIEQSSQWILQQRIAGGSTQRLAKVDFVDNGLHHIVPMLMPAFILMDAQKDFEEIITELQKVDPNVTALDTLIDVCTLHHIPEEVPNKKGQTEIVWKTTSKKTGRGWLVPMPIGYQGISPKYDAGLMQNIRNPEYPSQYVEAVYGLGKWVYPQRLTDNIKNAFWHYSYNEEQSLYLVTQNI
ncbi:type I-F CRISPR-associated protein Csy2 [Pasteurella skyensis]|uniref:Type I-F CRISPR-associated protein Csy2 n=1 Tax=Phocoenobacter skyensis TaxID=97481 RepID=A0AAJ6NAF7_9PAST|nr:type I-F CRISPR-associated protein Csy2 [Pasteurella skyensis]MDP8163021.1 type I-F CRISPR-associated protein Csy2 [Pasteurella skyensis]MDP8173171.1 type I-F CRISPR-associated protein Csy2 [Pasteurella skyensis]MDP8176393.1 type I-F CRISPR-associated protein Csy2 [Pasteurella skyensis]MDP8178896.1 type I-F CRISPR-associated protein Csy2 [Pasteurella skyensis]MDP8183718.1 type I-F CRISPR-associated protein Csy2 [Pasteurella skyensis]